MLTRLHTLEPRRYLLLIPGITLAVMMTGCGSTDFTSVSIESPVYSTGRTERHAMTSELIVADKRLDKSVDRLVKTPLVSQVREQIAEELRSTGCVIVIDGSQAKYSLHVNIEQLNYEIPGYATKFMMNSVLSMATNHLSEFFTQGTPTQIKAKVRLQAILSQRSNRVVWCEAFSGQHTETASMQTVKSHAVESSVLSLALQEAIAKLMTRLYHLPA
jgi:hypothetical protein